MKPRNFKQAAQASLKERWYPISKAESMGEMRKIWLATGCALCDLQESRTSYCSKCPLNDEEFSCCKEYSDWKYYLFGKDYEGAHEAALKLVKRLEIIARIGENDESATQ